MSMSDPVADMLTRIRNANSARKEHVDIPASSLKQEVLSVLKDKGYIIDFKMAEEEHHPWIRVYLKYARDGETVIKGIDRVSMPGCRVYVGVDDVPRILGGMGVAILSTSKGVMAGDRARSMKLGGEVLCKVW